MKQKVTTSCFSESEERSRLFKVQNGSLPLFLNYKSLNKIVQQKFSDKKKNTTHCTFAKLIFYDTLNIQNLL